uniref:Retrotransposon protein, putative, unclassified n=1 Tax=Oryza sativa subsp. japonica TaxID=39947 RepID=Q2QU78_ORYSJ|nr:retrotransposon protein, putative, unclassified [Oryza sativa Japonica Group]
MAEERESFESQWAPSDVTEDNLKEMVAHGVLPAKEIIGWRPAFGEAFPTPDTHEIVVFAHFFYGGFSLPTSRFFRGILNFYGISLHHLNPNSIVHIANFIHACEAFLDSDSLDFKVMKERMYKIFSNAIVVSYSHLLPVVPFNAFNPPPPEFALLKSDPPIAQHQSPRRQTGQGSGGPRIRSETQPNASDPVGQSDSRKRKLVPSDDEGDDTGKLRDKGATGRPPKPTNLKKKTSSRPEPKIRKSSRNESAEAGAGVNQEPSTENQSGTGSSQEIPEVGAQADNPRKQDTSSDPTPGSPVKTQESTRPRPEIITVDSLGPMIGDEEEIPRIQVAEDSRPPILVKWWDDDRQPQGIVINKQKEDEEVCLLKKALSQATRIVNRIHLRNKAKTATLERVNVVQAAKISQLEKQIQTLENDKAELARQRDSALKEVEDRKIKSQAQFDVLVNKINRLEGARDKVANAATPLIQAMFFNNAGPSTLDASEIFDKLRVAPDTYFKNIREAGSMGASMALAMTKSLYPKIDIDAVDGFADGTSEETALNLINDAQKAADTIAADVVERFQDVDLRPTGSDNSDDEKTDTD